MSLITFCPRWVLLTVFVWLPFGGWAQLDTLTRGQGNPEVEASVLFMDAIQARIKGDKARAIAYLQRVVSLQPEAAGAHYDLARLYMPDQLDLASTHIQKAIALQPANKYYREQYAQILAYGNDYEGAANTYRELARHEKHNEDYLHKAALLYQRAEKHMRALESLNELLATDPGNEEVMMQKQQIFLQINEVDEAIKVVKELMRMYPEDGRYYVLLAEVYMSNDRKEEAMKAYQDAEARFPDDPMVILSLAQYYRYLGDEGKYKDYLRKSLAHKAMDVEHQISILFRYIQEFGEDSSGKEEAMDLAALIAAQNPDHAEVHTLRGNLLFIVGKMDEAAEAYKRALAIDPGVYSTWQRLLYQYANVEQADSLIRYSEKCLRLFPNQAMVHYLNGVGHLFKGQYEPARKAIERALDLQPEEDTDVLAEMHGTLGDIYEALKDYSLSEAHYRKSLQLDPDNPTVLNNYSYYLSLRMVRLDEALTMSEKSLKLRPDEPSFLDTYGWILYKMGKYEQARDYIQRALDLSTGSNATLWDHLGDVYYRLGQHDKAKSSWQKAIDQGAEKPEDMERKIKEGLKKDE